MPKPIEYKKGTSLAACPKVLADKNKSAQLTSRFGLTIDQLQAGQMKVEDTDGNQLKIKHERLASPVTVHAKFFVPAQEVQAS